MKDIRVSISCGGYYYPVKFFTNGSYAVTIDTDGLFRDSTASPVAGVDYDDGKLRIVGIDMVCWGLI